MTFAEPNATKTALPVPQQFIAKLTTKGNQPITVNGLSAATGASIVTGALIETGADQTATVNLGPLGTLEIGSNTKLRLDYDDQGNVNVRLITGCVILRAKKKAEGEITTDNGSAGKTDRKKGGVLDVCWTNGGAVVNQGAAAAAGVGAGAGAAGGAAAGTAAGVGIPLSEAVATAIFAGAITSAAIATAAQPTSSNTP
jgi:hypothetical protein